MKIIILLALVSAMMLSTCEGKRFNNCNWCSEKISKKKCSPGCQKKCPPEHCYIKRPSCVFGCHIKAWYFNGKHCRCDPIWINKIQYFSIPFNNLFKKSDKCYEACG
ncbi:uncharacterized protein LOC144427181 [Styela clava]